MSCSLSMSRHGAFCCKLVTFDRKACEGEVERHGSKAFGQLTATYPVQCSNWEGFTFSWVRSTCRHECKAACC